MSKKLLHKAMTLGLILAIIFSGSFVLMEEAFEKSERTEGLREVAFINNQVTQPKTRSVRITEEKRKPTSLRKKVVTSFQYSVISDDFHIAFIYHASYLHV